MPSEQKPINSWKRYAALGGGLYRVKGFRVIMRTIRRDMMGRRLVTALMIVLLLSACSRPDRAPNSNSATDVGEPVNGDWIVVRYEGEPDTLNPIISASALANFFMYG